MLDPDCSANRAMMLPAAGDGNDWQDIGQLLSTLDNYENSHFAIVELLVSSVPCASGCCNMAFSVRPRTTDITVLRQIMGSTEFSFLNDLGREPTTILDAGANFGGSSLLFAALFPHAIIVSLMPAPDNFNILQINSARYANIIPLNVGLWDEASDLQLAKEECEDNPTALCGHWGYRVQVSKTARGKIVNSITIDGAAAMANITGFQYVKMDIEGSEARVLNNPAASPWLNNVRLLSVDIHDSLEALLEPHINHFFGNTFKMLKSGRLNVFMKQTWGLSA